MSKSKTVWEETDLPNFHGRKIYVLPGAGYSAAVKMFAACGLQRATNVETADIVCFLGGTDINPRLYQESPCPETGGADKPRDRAEEAVFHQCVQNKKVMFGICRGAQFLHVMNGGTLWQHVNNHAGRPHTIVDIEEGVVVEASSLHHQMMKYNEKMNLLAVTDEDIATVFKNAELLINKDNKHPDDSENPIELEVEACFYPRTKSLCIQGHPEIGPAPFMSWSMVKLKDFTIEWEQQSIAAAAVAAQLA